jgi:hypothetical protein
MRMIGNVKEYNSSIIAMESEFKGKQFMSRNVTEFRHLMKKHYINENDLNWVINLREHKSPHAIEPT